MGLEGSKEGGVVSVAAPRPMNYHLNLLIWMCKLNCWGEQGKNNFVTWYSGDTRLLSGQSLNYCMCM